MKVNLHLEEESNLEIMVYGELHALPELKILPLELYVNNLNILMVL
jgi:hypothetical protein